MIIKQTDYKRLYLKSQLELKRLQNRHDSLKTRFKQQGKDLRSLERNYLKSIRNE